MERNSRQIKVSSIWFIFRQWHASNPSKSRVSFISLYDFKYNLIYEYKTMYNGREVMPSFSSPHHLSSREANSYNVNDALYFIVITYN
jgi:hypothetical protein